MITSDTYSPPWEVIAVVDSHMRQIFRESFGAIFEAVHQEPFRTILPGESYRNKAEARFAKWLDLRLLDRDDPLIWYAYESITLKLGVRQTWTPDFLCQTMTHLEIHEVKGHMRGHAREKIKMAARMFPTIPIYIEWDKGAKKGFETELVKADTAGKEAT